MSCLRLIDAEFPKNAFNRSFNAVFRPSHATRLHLCSPLKMDANHHVLVKRVRLILRFAIFLARYLLLDQLMDCQRTSSSIIQPTDQSTLIFVPLKASRLHLCPPLQRVTLHHVTIIITVICYCYLYIINIVCIIKSLWNCSWAINNVNLLFCVCVMK